MKYFSKIILFDLLSAFYRGSNFLGSHCQPIFFWISVNYRVLSRRAAHFFFKISMHSYLLSGSNWSNWSINEIASSGRSGTNERKYWKKSLRWRPSDNLEMLLLLLWWCCHCFFGTRVYVRGLLNACLDIIVVVLVLLFWQIKEKNKYRSITWRIIPLLLSSICEIQKLSVIYGIFFNNLFDKCVSRFCIMQKMIKCFDFFAFLSVFTNFQSDQTIAHVRSVPRTVFTKSSSLSAATRRPARRTRPWSCRTGIKGN